MYNVLTKQIVLEIPKNGSRTLVDAVTLTWGKESMKCMGHATLTELLEDRIPAQVREEKQPTAPYQVVAVIRNPTTRLESMVNAYMNIKGATMSDAMRAAAQQSHIIFKPQWHFIDTDGGVDCELHLFTMSRILDAVKFITSDKMVAAPRKNDGRAKRKVSWLDISVHPMFNEVMSLYEPDLYIYENLTLTEGMMNHAGYN